MKVFVLWERYCPEGDSFIGIFSSYDNAYKYIINNYNLKEYTEKSNNNLYRYWINNKDEYEVILIDECNVDELLSTI